MSLFEGILALKIGGYILDEIRKTSPDEFDKAMKEPINSCECGEIKQGDTTICQICEVFE